MTDQELKDLVASLTVRMDEGYERMQRQLAQTDRQIERTNKQLGELGNKFGTFTEGMAWPSLEKMLRAEFGMDFVGQRQKAYLNGRSLEIDVLAYRPNEVYIVEVKSRLTQDGLERLLQQIAEFPQFFPHMKDRKIYGMIAAVDMPDDLRQAVLKRGLYLARLSDETFKLLRPRGFKPFAFNVPPAANGAANGHAKSKTARKK